MNANLQIDPDGAGYSSGILAELRGEYQSSSVLTPGGPTLSGRGSGTLRRIPLPETRWIRPWTSKACQSAGAFLTVKSLLHDSGADISGVSPSTELHEYTRRYPGFAIQVSQLAPGSLPAMSYRKPVYDACIAGYGVGMLLILAGGVLWSASSSLIHSISIAFLIGGALLSVAAYVGTWIAAKWVLPSEVRLGDLRTFGDLARALSKRPEGSSS